jgi:hypothetical protein
VIGVLVKVLFEITGVEPTTFTELAVTVAFSIRDGAFVMTFIVVEVRDPAETTTEPSAGRAVAPARMVEDETELDASWSEEPARAEGRSSSKVPAIEELEMFACPRLSTSTPPVPLTLIPSATRRPWTMSWRGSERVEPGAMVRVMF